MVIGKHSIKCLGDRQMEEDKSAKKPGWKDVIWWALLLIAFIALIAQDFFKGEYYDAVISIGVFAAIIAIGVVTFLSKDRPRKVHPGTAFLIIATAAVILIYLVSFFSAFFSER